jgi:hypothetical protein
VITLLAFKEPITRNHVIGFTFIAVGGVLRFPRSAVTMPLGGPAFAFAASPKITQYLRTVVMTVNRPGSIVDTLSDTERRLARGCW